MVENCAGNLCPISREMFRQPASRALKRSFIPTLHSSHCCGGFWYIYSLNQFGLLSLQPHFTKKDWAKPNRYLCDLGGKKETHVIVDTFYSLKKRGLGGQQKINVFVLNFKYLFNQIQIYEVWDIIFSFQNWYLYSPWWVSSIFLTRLCSKGFLLFYFLRTAHF